MLKIIFGDEKFQIFKSVAFKELNGTDSESAVKSKSKSVRNSTPIAYYESVYIFRELSNAFLLFPGWKQKQNRRELD